MNDKDRKNLQTTIEALELASAQVEELKDNESDKASNVEEAFPGSEKAERLQSIADALEEAEQLLMDAIEKLQEAMEE